MSPSIFVVDDNPALIQLVASMLEGVASIRFATSGQRALELMRVSAPDLILLDAEMPGLDGFGLCTLLKADPELADVPVMFLTEHDAAEFELRGLDAGAADFIAKPISQALLLARVRTQLRVKSLTDRLRQLANLDGLTGIGNRRAFDDALQAEWRRTRRPGVAIAVALFDVDHFKQFNDLYGHPAGDECLRTVASVLREACGRPGDLAARYGGEEFALVLPVTDMHGVLHVVQAAIRSLSERQIPHARSATAAFVTMSAGIAFADSNANLGDGHRPFSTRDLLRKADEALYEAKRAGRNQAVLRTMGGAGAPGAGAALSSAGETR